MSGIVSRRRLLTSAALGAGGLLAGCDRLGESPAVREILFSADAMNRHAQRLITDRHALAREFEAADLSPFFRGNGTQNPQGADYRAHAAENFARWRLEVGGLVARPQSLSMAQIRSMPARTQITRHDCVEGWSCIAKWTGVPLSLVLDAAVVKPSARYVVFHCLDTIENSLSGEVKYYGSIDLVDARHPQTILAYGVNGKPLPVENGAPLRARVERQLGYKMPKYLKGIELIDSFGAMGLGKGGYWEDRGYDWYGGI